MTRVEPQTPPPRRRDPLDRALGHEFADPRLLARALTHPSAQSGAGDNQRLEFLGDRVLGLVIAEQLLARHPDEAEGRLAPRLNALVRRETLAEIAGEVGLGAHLALGRSESTGGGRAKAAILADAMEAVIAAVYLDGGLEAARGVIHRHWASRLDDPGAVPVDAKSAVQEWALGRGLATPRYTLVGRDGPDHLPQFTVALEMPGAAPVTGHGRSKKQAEQQAAARMLALLRGETP